MADNSIIKKRTKLELSDQKSNKKKKTDPESKGTTGKSNALSSLFNKKIVNNVLPWPSDLEKQKLILNAAADRSMWNINVNMLNLLTKLEKNHGSHWSPTEKKEYENIMKQSKYIFKSSSESDSTYEPPHILDGILEEDMRILNSIEYEATKKADYNVIFH